MFGKNEPRRDSRSVSNGAAKAEAPDSTATAQPSSRVQHSILSSDTTLTGDLVSSGDITVEGTIDGSIRCRSLTLTGQPNIKGRVEAETAHVCGEFSGELRANKVVLNKTAKMRGDIYQEILEVHDGAQFEGKVARLPETLGSPAAAKPVDAAGPAKDAAEAKASSVG